MQKFFTKSYSFCHFNIIRKTHTYPSLYFFGFSGSEFGAVDTIDKFPSGLFIIVNEEYKFESFAYTQAECITFCNHFEQKSKHYCVCNFLAEVVGFEPTHTGVRIPGLTTWLHSNVFYHLIIKLFKLLLFIIISYIILTAKYQHKSLMTIHIYSKCFRKIYQVFLTN